jgi:hypothetical protein
MISRVIPSDDSQPAMLIIDGVLYRVAFAVFRGGAMNTLVSNIM